MKLVLLIGATLNIAGAAKFLAPALATAVSRSAVTQAPEGYLQFKLFTGGTAATFATIYLYLFLHPSHVVPFLIFGAALKTWAFLLSVLLYVRNAMPTRTLVEFGLTNAAVAALFWIYILTEP